MNASSHHDCGVPSLAVAVALTDQCNARCLHCAFSCGPDKNTEIPLDYVRRLIDEAVAAAEGRPVDFQISGGEPFLDLERLETVVHYAASAGCRVTCMTNAFWATSDERASSIAVRVARAGLGLLGVSASRFHRQFVDLDRVRRALLAARGAGIRTGLKCAVLADELSAGGMPAWLDFADLADAVECFAVVGPGREGARIEPDAIIRTPGLPSGRCPSQVTMVDEKGLAAVCCASPKLGPMHQLGSFVDESLVKLLQRSRTRGTFQILREAGPRAFADEMIRRGEGGRLRAAYTSVCDLCTHISSDVVMTAIAEEMGEAVERRQLRETFAVLMSE